MKGNNVKETEDRRPLLPQPCPKAFEEDGEG